MKEGQLFYAARHGESEGDKRNVFQGQGVDLPLTAYGIFQAHELGSDLRERQKRGDVSIGAIYSSPSKRAFITADIVSMYLELEGKVVQDTRLLNRNGGILEGMRMSDIHDMFGDQGITDSAPEGGESLVEFEERIVDAVVDILGHHPSQGVLFVSHRGVIRAQQKYFKPLNPDAVLNIDNAHYYDFEVMSRPDVPTEFGR